MEQVSDEFDVLVVGGGPGGLSTACRLKQLAAEEGRELRVCLVEKGSELGELFLRSTFPLPLFLLKKN